MPITSGGVTYSSYASYASATSASSGSSAPSSSPSPAQSSAPEPVKDSRTELQKKMGVTLSGISSGMDKPGEATAKFISIGGFATPEQLEQRYAKEDAIKANKPLQIFDNAQPLPGEVGYHGTPDNPAGLGYTTISRNDRGGFTYQPNVYQGNVQDIPSDRIPTLQSHVQFKNYPSQPGSPAYTLEQEKANQPYNKYGIGDYSTVKGYEAVKSILQPYRGAIDNSSMLGEGFIPNFVKGLAQSPADVIEFGAMLPAVGEFAVRHPKEVGAGIVIGMPLVAYGMYNSAIDNPGKFAGGLIGQAVLFGGMAKVAPAIKIPEFTMPKAIETRFPMELDYLQNIKIDIASRIPTKDAILETAFGSSKPYSMELSAIKDTFAANAPKTPARDIVLTEMFVSAKPYSMEVSAVRSIVESNIPKLPPVGAILNEVFGSEHPYSMETSAIKSGLASMAVYATSKIPTMEIPSMPSISNKIPDPTAMLRTIQSPLAGESIKSVFGSETPYRMELDVIKGYSKQAISRLPIMPDIRGKLPKLDLSTDKVYTKLFGSAKPYSDELAAIRGFGQSVSPKIKSYIPTQSEILENIFGSRTPYMDEIATLRGFKIPKTPSFGDIKENGFGSRNPYRDELNVLKQYKNMVKIPSFNDAIEAGFQATEYMGGSIGEGVLRPLGERITRPDYTYKSPEEASNIPSPSKEEIVSLMDRTIYTGESFDIIRGGVEDILYKYGIDVAKVNRNIKVMRTSSQDLGAEGLVGVHYGSKVTKGKPEIFIAEGLKGREVVDTLFHEYSHEISRLGSIGDSFIQTSISESTAYSFEKFMSKAFSKEYGLPEYTQFKKSLKVSDIPKVAKFISEKGELPSPHYFGEKINIGFIARQIKSEYVKKNAFFESPKYTQKEYVTNMLKDTYSKEPVSPEDKYGQIITHGHDIQKQLDYKTVIDKNINDWTKLINVFEKETDAKLITRSDILDVSKPIFGKLGIDINKLKIELRPPDWFKEQGHTKGFYDPNDNIIYLDQQLSVINKLRVLSHEASHNINKMNTGIESTVMEEATAIQLQHRFIAKFNEYYETTFKSFGEEHYSTSTKLYRDAANWATTDLNLLEIKNEYRLNPKYTQKEYVTNMLKDTYSKEPISLEERYGGLGQFGHDVQKAKRKVTLTQLMERPKAAEEKPVETLDLTSLDKYGSYVQPKGDTMDFLTTQQARFKYTGKTIFDVESAKLQSSQESAKGTDYSAMRKALAKQHQEMVSNLPSHESKIYGYGEQSLTRAQMKSRLDSKYGTKNIQSPILISDSASQLKNIQSSESKSMLLAGMMPISKSATKSIKESGMMPISLLKSAAININDVPQESRTLLSPLVRLIPESVVSPTIHVTPLSFPTIPDIYAPYTPIQPPTFKQQPRIEPPRFETPRPPREPTPEIPKRIILPHPSFDIKYPTLKRKKSSRSDFGWYVENKMPTAKSLFGKLSRPGRIPKI